MPPAPLNIFAADPSAASAAEGDGNPFNYIPTAWICILFIVLFSLTTAVHTVQAVWLRVWYMLPTVALCGLIEIIGWAGRYWGHKNAYIQGPFLMQICTTIMAPSFMTAAMFLILPRIISELGQEYSRMPPRLYAVVFLTADATALVLQAAGGGVASSASTLAGANRGGNIMLAGIVIQLAAVTIFDLLAIEFTIRYALGRPARQASGKPQHRQPMPKRVGLMLLGLAIASVFILIRSVYRTIELTDGWQVLSVDFWIALSTYMFAIHRNGEIISTEKWFNWFDGGAIVVAMVTFNVFHPGFLIKDFGNRLLNYKQNQVASDELEKEQRVERV